MAHIHVIFPKKGKPLISCETKPVLEGEFINWHIYSKNPKVKKVRIEFSSPEATYFSDGKDGKDGRRMEKSVEDGSPIWGRAPNYKTARRRDKYTIFGLDGNNRVVCKDDPEIISNDPKH
jgi:hypothetical protein